MDMETQVLRWFQQVADGTTVTEVSEIDAVTQSGVSRALARLETEIGTPLLYRAGRTLRMTRAGAAFKGHVDGLLHELDDGLAAVSAVVAPDTGTVAVAFQLSLGTWLVPDLVAGFRVRHPAVQFALHPVRDELVVPALAGGQADVEITTARPADPDLRWRPLVGEPLRLAVRRDHPLADHGAVSLARATREPFVALRRTYLLRRLGDELCRRAGFTPDVAFEGDDLPIVLGFVAAGLGVAIVPSPRPSGLAATAGSMRFLDLVDPGATREIGVAWSDRRRLLPAAEQFRRYVVAQTRRLANGTAG
jgi:LysR family transcriptional regulator, transcription activator of glutamate synthase operon